MVVLMIREDVRIIFWFECCVKRSLIFSSDFEQCPRSAHRELRNRFFDWFHQIEKLEHKSQYYGRQRFCQLFMFSQDFIPGSIDNCHPMVSYMFYHFDFTNDSELNDDELNSIEHLKDESCTDIFFRRCDHDGNHRIFPYEWCNCFEYAR